MRKNAKLIKSPYGSEFKRGQKVYSFGDETTIGYIDDWDFYENCWRLKRHNEEGYHWWAEDEPYIEPINVL